MSEKRCPKCGKTKPASKFGRRRHPKSGQWLLQSYCKPCHVKANRQWSRTPKGRAAHQAKAAKAYARDKADPERMAKRRATAAKVQRDRRRKDPEAIRAAYERWRERLKADPDRHQLLLAKRRIGHRIKREREAGTLELRRGHRGSEDYETPTHVSDLVDAGPLREFVREAFPGVGTVQLAAILLMDCTNAQRIFEGGQQHVTLFVVDRALTHGLGRPDLLNVLYPYHEPEPEPEPVPDLIGDYLAKRKARRAA
jgi:hypothetical protein